MRLAGVLLGLVLAAAVAAAEGWTVDDVKNAVRTRGAEIEGSADKAEKKEERALEKARQHIIYYEQALFEGLDERDKGVQKTLVKLAKDFEKSKSPDPSIADDCVGWIYDQLGSTARDIFLEAREIERNLGPADAEKVEKKFRSATKSMEKWTTHSEAGKVGKAAKALQKAIGQYEKALKLAEKAAGK